MFDGKQKRVVSMWFPRLASDRVLRVRQIEAPFALTIRQNNTERLYCLNMRAESSGLYRGMGLADARAFCRELVTLPASPDQDARFLTVLRRWATRYCPWIGRDGTDGLVLDVTGATHLFGGEAAMLDDMHTRAGRAGLAVRLGLADTRGAAWALAHHGAGRDIAPPGGTQRAIAALPVAALRLDESVVTALQRLGLRNIGHVIGTPRASLTRRFGPGLVMRLDQALGAQAETVGAEAEPPHYAVRLSYPEPIGLLDDVMAGTSRLLDVLCRKLRRHEAGARELTLSLRRVDRGSQQVNLRLAAAMNDPQRILPLFGRGLEGVDAGFGIDQMRLEAVLAEALPLQQLRPAGDTVRQADSHRLDDLITRIGTRIGLDNIQRFQPVDSHIPEHGFTAIPATCSRAAGGWLPLRPRPLCLFPPEPIAGQGAQPPARFRWRRMALNTARVTGPERIAPEWWRDDDGWRSGVRDYWLVETRQGRRLWLFHTPQNPGWFVQGEFS